MPGYDKIPTCLTSEQRLPRTHIPSDLSNREIARYYTFTEEELELIRRRRRASNRLGIAVQLTLLKFPGQTLIEIKDVPKAVLATIAEQVGIPASALLLSAIVNANTRCMSIWMNSDESVDFVHAAGVSICWWPDHRFLALTQDLDLEKKLDILKLANEAHLGSPGSSRRKSSGAGDRLLH